MPAALVAAAAATACPAAMGRAPAAAGSASRLPAGLVPSSQQLRWTLAPQRHSQPSRCRRAARVAAVAGPQAPPRLGAPLQLGSPASQKRREEILNRIDTLIQEELESQLPLPSVDELVADDFKESERRKLRTVFDFDLWKRHRSSSRYSRHMFGLLESRTVRWIGAPLAYCVSLSVAVGVYHNLADAGIVPEVLPELKTQLPIQLTSAALSTLLVLRTNTSYQRWDEARKMWGLIVNRSRDFTRQALGYIPDDQPELQDMLCRWVVAYSRSLMCHLRSDEDLYRELATKLKPQELEALMSSSHRPNYTVQVLTAIMQAAKLPGVDIDPRDSGANVKASALVRMDEQLTQFADVTGGCERILRTPVPLAYSRHNSRMLTLWMTLLPFSLWDTCGWATPFVVLIVAFLLLGVKEIGLNIEEPFSILPLETICNTIETNVWELHRTHSTAAAEAQQEAARRGSWSQQAQQGPQQVDADLLAPAAATQLGVALWRFPTGAAYLLSRTNLASLIERNLRLRRQLGISDAATATALFQSQGALVSKFERAEVMVAHLQRLQASGELSAEQVARMALAPSALHLTPAEFDRRWHDGGLSRPGASPTDITMSDTAGRQQAAAAALGELLQAADGVPGPLQPQYLQQGEELVQRSAGLWRAGPAALRAGWASLQQLGLSDSQVVAAMTMQPAVLSLDWAGETKQRLLAWAEEHLGIDTFGFLTSYTRFVTYSGASVAMRADFLQQHHPAMWDQNLCRGPRTLFRLLTEPERLCAHAGCTETELVAFNRAWLATPAGLRWGGKAGRSQRRAAS
ncbi:hypothetical protein C2E21_7229 [Chlorella sorokiniana]|uniref:Uncharacterized protein n=1 Tax=Chlorella sorokiniana TaxID=3076 RepID=A0A2P6THZ5_CHLSO|nr:hypothetical protein C2E21_7229 [Chlorella sorokiniana]|eukprot:PRW33911.1 hypothetical protein C2E21_7229 [Chlorella sorokiniana]